MKRIAILIAVLFALPSIASAQYYAGPQQQAAPCPSLSAAFSTIQRTTTTQTVVEEIPVQQQIVQQVVQPQVVYTQPQVVYTQPQVILQTIPQLSYIPTLTYGLGGYGAVGLANYGSFGAIGYGGVNRFGAGFYGNSFNHFGGVNRFGFANVSSGVGFPGASAAASGRGGAVAATAGLGGASASAAGRRGGVAAASGGLGGSAVINQQFGLFGRVRSQQVIATGPGASAAASGGRRR